MVDDADVGEESYSCRVIDSCTPLFPREWEIHLRMSIRKLVRSGLSAASRY